MKLLADSRLYADVDYCINYLINHDFNWYTNDSITYHCYWYGDIQQKNIISSKSIDR